MNPPDRAPAAAAATPPGALLRAIRHVCRPLAHLLLAHQITLPMLVELLKSVFVEVAVREFPIEGKRQTDSRVHLLTGVHRKDVRRLRARGVEPLEAPASVSLGAQLVARWTGMAAYQDAEGRPRPLPRSAEAGREPGFDDLVSSVSTDIRSRAVLDEWLRLGVATLDAEDRVCLNAEAFVPSRGFDEKAFYFGRGVHDHIAACAHNLSDVRPPLFDRSAHYGGLTGESVAELSKLAARVGTEALQAINRRALELQKRDEGKGTARRRIDMGIFFYQADTAEEEQIEDSDAADA
jgi:hypothetical protein